MLWLFLQSISVLTSALEDDHQNVLGKMCDSKIFGFAMMDFSDLIDENQLKGIGESCVNDVYKVWLFDFYVAIKSRFTLIQFFHKLQLSISCWKNSI